MIDKADERDALTAWRARPDEEQVSLAEFCAGWEARAAYELERTAGLKAALKGLAMRNFVYDRTFCWCDGVVYDPPTHQHDPECTRARAALAATAPAPGEEATG